MKAITMYQPWASLLAIGAKRCETRSWFTDYRGPIAIHAGKNRSLKNLRLMEGQPFKMELARAGYLTPVDLPFGAVIAVGKLVICQHITKASRDAISETELLFGDWTPGRYAWRFQKIQSVGPYPCRGFQRIWNWAPKEGEHEWGDAT